MNDPMRVLAVSGSLRAASSNTILLRAAALVAPEGVEVVVYGGVGGLPHFNPDLDRALDDPLLPGPVRALRAAVGAADALLVCSPEYAHGVPGSLKNALDWLVGGSEMPGKPVALVNASPHSVHAPAQLAETLRTMSVRVVEGSPFLVPLPHGAGSEAAAADPAVAAGLRDVLRALRLTDGAKKASDANQPEQKKRGA